VRLVHRRRVTLALKKSPLLQGSGRAVLPFGDIKDNGMGVELRSGVAVHRAGGVVLELGRYEPPGPLGGVVAADPRLRVPLQLGERGGHRLPVSQAHTLIAANKCGE